jgi:MipA family protein
MKRRVKSRLGYLYGKNMLLTSLKFSLCVTLALIPLAGYSQDSDVNSSIAVGLGITSSASPYRGYKEQIWPIPVVSYDGDRYYVQGLGGGVYLFKNASFDLSVNNEIATNYFKPSDTNDPALKRLKTRDPSLMAGFRARYRGTWGLLQLNVGHDVLGNSVGETAQFEYGFPFREGPLTIVPAVGEGWSNAKFNNYYYGISPSSALESGLPSYQMDSSCSPYFKLTAAYRISDQWNAFAQAKYTRLASNIGASPMVDSRSLPGFLLGVTYKF